MVLITSSNAQTNFYFPQTGHSLSDNFLDFYLSIPNVESLFGYPITDVFYGELGNRMQYFQKVRLEEDAFGKIFISPIGRLAYSPGNDIIEQESILSCLQSSNWEYPVCFDFLSYYYQHGSESIFGKPISGIEMERGRIVQYFENIFLEWHPDGEEKIKIGNLGSIYFNKKNENELLLLPNLLNASEYPILELYSEVFVEHALLEPSELQTLYVYVTDQNGIPLSGVNIFTSLYFSSDEDNTQEIPVGITDENGISQIYFISDVLQKENIRIVVTLNYKSISINSETSFRINH